MKETKTYKKMLNWRKNNVPKYIFVHHSGGTDRDAMADTSSHTAKGMELWHLGKGWDGLGYHYVIHKDGEIWRGRPEHRNGAHARGYNTRSIGICLSGNFDAKLPSKKQEVALKKLLSDISRKYSIPHSEIKPHRSVANKTCYGMKLSDSWARDLIKSQTTAACPLALQDANVQETLDHLLKLVNQK